MPVDDIPAFLNSDSIAHGLNHVKLLTFCKGLATQPAAYTIFKMRPSISLPVQTTSKALGMVPDDNLLNTIDAPMVANNIGSITQFHT